MIQRHEIKNKIEEILNEVNQQYEVLKQFDTDVNVEILYAKVAYLANFSDILRKISSIEKIEGSIEYSMSDRSKIVELPVLENTFKTAEQIAEDQRKNKEKVVEEKELEIPEPFLIIKNSEELEKVESPQSTSSEKIIVEHRNIENTTEIKKSNDLFSSFQNDVQTKQESLPNDEKLNSINDVFAQKKEPVQTFSSSRIAMPISDLRMAFGLNDRILFIKELFNGYNLAFTEVLDVLNNKKDFDEAKNYLVDNYYDKNDWAQKEEVVEQFYTIVKNRYTEV